MEKEKIKEKKIDILALWRSFITPAVEEASTEEVILNDSKLSETKKKELLKTLNKCDTIMRKMSKSYTKDLKVDPKTLLNEKEIISKNKEENKEEEKDYGEERDDK
jgi:hypothetical protein